MNLRHLAASASVFGALVSVACSSSDSISMGSDAAGTAGAKTAGGTANGSAGDRPLGGGSNGGSSNGGTANPGDAGAGESSAGTSAGGMSQAGSTNGGSTSGGSANGGSTNTGDGGAPTSMCDLDEDCVACAFDASPANTQQCYCVGCSNAPLTQEQCAANQAQYQQICANVALPCPAIKCLPPPPATCVNHQCVIEK